MEELRDMDTYDLVRALIGIVGELAYRNENASDKVSYFSKKRSEVEHEIEVTSFNAFQGYRYAKEIQDLSMYRRMAKRDIDILSTMNCTKGMNIDTLYNGVTKLMNSKFLKDHVKENNYKWSNYGQLGELTYSKMDDEYNKKFGELDDQIVLLQQKYDRC